MLCPTSQFQKCKTKIKIPKEVDEYKALLNILTPLSLSQKDLISLSRLKDKKKIHEYRDDLNKTMDMIEQMEIDRTLPQQLDYKHYFQEQIAKN